MNVPKIKTTEGKEPVTIVPNKLLVEAYLNAATNKEEKELVELLRYAEPSNEKAATILRKCLKGSATLVAVYPGNEQTPPKGATLVGSIPDGGLYFV